MLKNISFFSFFFFLLPVIHAQTATKAVIVPQNAPFEWGKISKADLDMKVYPLDSSADAVVLSNYGDMELGTDLPTYINFKVHKRVKLFKKSAFESEGLVKIRYYVRDKEHDVNFNILRAQIYYPDSRVVSLAEKDFLDEKVNEKVFYKKIAQRL